MKGFDRVASYYDFLARLAFGKSIIDAQEYFLSEIREGDRILMLGGGTGWILESIFKVTKPGVIWYVDNAKRMVEKSQSRNVDSSKIHFIHGTFESIPPDLKVDVVITNFFLDIFSKDELQKLIEDIKSKMKPQGTWLCSDFVDTGKWRHKMLLRSMYLFFRITANVKTISLPDWEGNLLTEGFVSFKEKTFWNGFIKSIVFKDAN